jgi:hypothetical protein
MLGLIPSGGGGGGLGRPLSVCSSAVGTRVPHQIKRGRDLAILGQAGREDATQWHRTRLRLDICCADANPGPVRSIDSYCIHGGQKLGCITVHTVSRLRCGADRHEMDPVTSWLALLTAGSCEATA